MKSATANKAAAATSFGRMCRACMGKEQNFHSIRDVGFEALKICEMLQSATPLLHIQDDDDQLPELICSVCLNKLNIAYHFQAMCIATDKRLREQLLHNKPTKDTPATVPPASSAIALAAVQADPLLADTELMLRDCLKMEISEEHASQLNINYALLAEHNVAGSASEVAPSLPYDQRHASDSEWSESDESENTAALKSKQLPSTLRRGRSKTQTMLSSSVHNETGVDEIEKPDARNRRRGHFPCPDCDKIFDRPYRLRRHAVVHSAERPFQCETCKYRFVTQNHLTFHKVSLNTCVAKAARHSLPPAEGYKCHECPRRFEKRESLSAHTQSHRKEAAPGPFRCQHCQKEFKKLTALQKHAKTHAEGQQKCHLCSKSFALNALLIEHLNKHSGLKSFVCIYCDKSFQQNSTLKEHLRTHTGEKPFLCPQCGKAFQNGSNMRQHLLRHTGERRYQCPECPSRFACHSDQIKHMSIHRSVKPHVCDICGSRFSRSYTLTKHKHIHTGERPHKCEECNMTFVFIDHMRRHMRTHTGEKPYKCKFCDRAYAESGDLTKHLRSHVGEKTYICSQCPEAFKYLTELRMHATEHYKEQQQHEAAPSPTPSQATCPKLGNATTVTTIDLPSAATPNS